MCDTNHTVVMFLVTKKKKPPPSRQRRIASKLHNKEYENKQKILK